MGKSVTGTNYAWSFLSQFAEEQSFQKDVVYARFPSNEASLYAERLLIYVLVLSNLV